MQLIRSGEPTEMAGYPPCAFSLDGDYQVYMKNPKNLKDEDSKIRCISLCFIEELHLKTDGQSKTNPYGGKYTQVPGGKSTQMYFSQNTTLGSSRERRIELVLKLRYGTLHVENGRATSLTVARNGYDTIYDEKFEKKKYLAMVLLKWSEFEPIRQHIFHLENLTIDYYRSEEEFKQHYLTAGKKLNLGLFPDILGPGPKQSFFTRLLGGSPNEYVNLRKEGMQRIAPIGETGETKSLKTPPVARFKPIFAKKVNIEDNDPKLSQRKSEKKRNKFNFIGKLSDFLD